MLVRRPHPASTTRIRLTIDRAEADAVDRVLAECQSTEMVMLAPGGSATATATLTQVPPETPPPAPDVDALAMWDDNGNGRITCAEARAHGIAPVRRGTRLISTCATRTGTAWCANRKVQDGGCPCIGTGPC